MSQFEGTGEAMAKALAQRLRALLGDEGVSSDIESRVFHSTDLLEPGETCDLVVKPASIEELEQAVTLVAEADYALAPRGGGFTYVRGYTPACKRMVTIDLGRMNRIIEVNEEDMYVTVEAGVTWRQLYEELKPRGVRLPFFGTFSGRGATVGGGLSNGALFFGTARYGTAAEIVLGMEVVLGTGKRLHTGQLVAARARKPFFRSFGPDTTGLFVHDAGSFGVKAHVTLRLIRTPAHADYLSFGFRDRSTAIAALSEIGRSELAEEAFVMDPEKTRAALAAPSNLARDARTLAKVIMQEGNIIRGLRAGVQLALGGRSFVEEGCFSLHMACGGRSRAAVDADLATARTLLTGLGGEELPNSIPKTSRADIFASLDAVVGAKGERFVAINAKVAHSEARELIDAAEALIESHRAEVDAKELEISRLLTVISNHAFSYEIVFTWRDAWFPIHIATMSPAARASFTESEPRPETRALVMTIRQQIIDLFAEKGAASSQIGRSYHFADILREEPRALIEGIKTLIDPDRRVNPGALGLS